MNSKQLLVLALALALLLVGCGEKSEVLDSTTGVTSTTEASAPATSGSPLEDSDFDDETVPTETEDQTEPTTKPTNPADPTDTVEPETTAPTVAPTQPTAQDQMDYEKFHNMSARKQQAFMESFDSLDQFFAWYNQAKAAYEAANPPIDVGDGNIDMGDLIG